MHLRALRMHAANHYDLSIINVLCVTDLCRMR